MDDDFTRNEKVHKGDEFVLPMVAHVVVVSKRYDAASVVVVARVREN
jgi:hypothetical protein